jgi:hypothetical protein
MAGFFEYGDEIPGVLKGSEFIDRLIYCQFFKEDTVPCRQLVS